jgi:hypothetical protein
LALISVPGMPESAPLPPLATVSSAVGEPEVDAALDPVFVADLSSPG